MWIERVDFAPKGAWTLDGSDDAIRISLLTERSGGREILAESLRGRAFRTSDGTAAK